MVQRPPASSPMADELVPCPLCRNKCARPWQGSRENRMWTRPRSTKKQHKDDRSILDERLQMGLSEEVVILKANTSVK